MIDPIREFFLSFGDMGLVVWTLLKIIVIVLPITIGVAFYTLAERKVIGWMHVRHGPQFVGGFMGIGVIQAFADVFKMLFKELIVPTNASPFLYRLAPLLALAPALAQAKVSSSTLLRVDPSLSRNIAGTTLAGVSLASDESSAGW